MKTGDKFFNISVSQERCYYDFHLYTVDKISKDGKKVRTLGGIIDINEKLLDSMQKVQKLINKCTRESHTHFAVRWIDYPTGESFGEIYPVLLTEDEFDETVHFYISGRSVFTVEASLAKTQGFSKIEEKKIGERHFVSYWFATGLDGLFSFLAGKADMPLHTEPSLLEKFNEWQEKFGYDKTDEFWKDFKGGTEQLEYAIDNNIDCADYDRWQCIQRILKHELKYETANELLNTLYEKEEIEIFECE